MSYSFTVRAASQAEAKTKVAAELDKVIANQSAHTKDRDQAIAATNAYIDLLPADPGERDVLVSVHGSLSGTWRNNTIEDVIGASVGITASLTNKVAPT